VAVLPHVSRVIVIHKGQISVDGPRDEVLARMKSTTAQADSVAA
jgi:hypothetical protein